MKAIALFSGGLDSLLSMKLITMQGIEVVALYIDTGFGGRKDSEKFEYLNRAVKQVGAELKVVDVKEQFIQDILFDPKYGYGKNFNPCIDCHGNMFRVASTLMIKWGASFIISGEVLGQRPMSQRKEALDQVKKLSTLDDLILRPMSAKLMSPTKPELEGWVDRDKLLDISGRSRIRQIELAKEYKIIEYESPAGGCLLTDEAYSNKIKDFISYDKSFDAKTIEILKFGRHLRLPNNTKLVISRNQEENAKLLEIGSDKFIQIDIGDIKGPVAFIDKEYAKDDLNLALSLVLTYSKTDFNKEYNLKIKEKKFTAKPLKSKELAKEYFIKL